MAATPKRELAVFTKRNILKEIDNEADPAKKAALRKERTGKLAAMKSMGDTRTAAWLADKEMMGARPSMAAENRRQMVANNKSARPLFAAGPTKKVPVAPAKKAPTKTAPKKAKK